jgi:hypothetical protein
MLGKPAVTAVLVRTNFNQHQRLYAADTESEDPYIRCVDPYECRLDIETHLAGTTHIKRVVDTYSLITKQRAYLLVTLEPVSRILVSPDSFHCDATKSIFRRFMMRASYSQATYSNYAHPVEGRVLWRIDRTPSTIKIKKLLAAAQCRKSATFGRYKGIGGGIYFASIFMQRT